MHLVLTKLMVLRDPFRSPGCGKCSRRSGRRQVRRQWGGKGGKNRFILELLWFILHAGTLSRGGGSEGFASAASPLGDFWGFCGCRFNIFG